MLTVYVPRTRRRLAVTLPAGTALVGAATPAADRVRCYYQPPGPAVNIVTFADRAYHAASRLRAGASTHLQLAADTRDLLPVGDFCESSGRVIPAGTAGRQALADWCGAAFTDRELDCEGAQHFARERHWRALAAGPDPALARFARAQLERGGARG